MEGSVRHPEESGASHWDSEEVLQVHIHKALYFLCFHDLALSCFSFHLFHFFIRHHFFCLPMSEMLLPRNHSWVILATLMLSSVWYRVSIPPWTALVFSSIAAAAPAAKLLQSCPTARPHRQQPSLGFKFTYRTGTTRVQCSKTGKEDEFGVHMCAGKKQYPWPRKDLERPSCKVGPWLTSGSLHFCSVFTIL